jgi:intraflagellar transport protein 80
VPSCVLYVGTHLFGAFASIPISFFAVHVQPHAYLLMYAALDPDLSGMAKIQLEPSIVSSFGPSPVILAFTGPKLSVRKNDGCVVHATVSNYAPLLYECTSAGKWAEAVRLARFVKQDVLWAALAVLALQGKNLDAAEIALAAVRAVDKLNWVLHVKDLPLPELRNAELAVYRRQVDEAEGILLQATPMLLYRAIKLNIACARWERALQLAQQHKAHIDTVLWYRADFLQSMNRYVQSLMHAVSCVWYIEMVCCLQE